MMVTIVLYKYQGRGKKEIYIYIFQIKSVLEYV